MGLMLDNARIITNVFSIVFPSDEVIDKIIAENKKECLIFSHHPVNWNINADNPFIDIDKRLMKQLKECGISLYVLHAPLDKNGRYSTSISLAKALDITPEKDFLEYYGVSVGSIGSSKAKDIFELEKIAKKIIGPCVKKWNYGDPAIKNGKVAIIAGGGNIPEAIEAIHENGINTFLTGITRPSKDFLPALKAHEMARRYKINIIGGTHYGTERFASQAMCQYFDSLGLPCIFVAGKCDKNDLDY
jgi:putative NIF3 family GTP cyclohydrolase 1 type 2